MSQNVPFQARARAIDHLGRGQIADAPTAISELWKNSYDAYARNVELHLFDGGPTLAAILDDGAGMSRDDIVNRWLVLGTENKVELESSGAPETFGLPQRTRQGEKGIGRLSAAFLAPGTVLISKKKDEDYVAVLIDWRLFENPFLSLDDIRLPVENYSGPEELVAGLPSLVPALLENLGGATDDKGERLSDAWTRFSEHESSSGLIPTADSIRDCWKSMPLGRRHLNEWLVFTELVEHGTAMFMVDLNNELGVWVRSDEAGEEVDEIKSRLRETLTAFTDPYLPTRPEFDYGIYVHRLNGDQCILSAGDVFGIDSLRELEHHIEGVFDERGVFEGRIVAFGKDLGVKKYAPKRQLTDKGRDKLGPFSFVIGTFEVEERKSTHDSNMHAFLEQQAERYSGVFVFRDGLRVMPYGRSNSDFLGLEERRSKHAGRYFFSHRRSFGRISFTRKDNSSLKDKAGREGLVDNRAFREMRILVVEFLIDSAKKYFGTDSAVRDEMLPAIMERKIAQKQAADLLRIQRRKSIRQFLKENAVLLTEATERAESLVAQALAAAESHDQESAALIGAGVSEVRALASALRPPTPPSRLGELVEPWRSYRDGYQRLRSALSQLSQSQAAIDALVSQSSPHEILKKRYAEQNAIITRQISTHSRDIESRLSSLAKTWQQRLGEDRHTFSKQASSLLDAAVDQSQLIGSIKVLEILRSDLSEKLSSDYGAIVAALDHLIAGVDLQGVIDISNELREELEEQLADIRAVAQIGVTVEIIGHELETLDSEVRRNLLRLPGEVRVLEPFKNALSAHQALADRLRFLAPMKISGYRAREVISGSQIAEYMAGFFEKIIASSAIDFVVTDRFKSIGIVDIPSRIYPVFINLVNNAIYWVSQSVKRSIVIDFVDGLVVVSDSGPGVDPEDVPRLFTLFYTTRRSGRGVGLYLSRANLSVAGHKIRYAQDDDPKILSGANFIIDFKGVFSHV